MNIELLFEKLKKDWLMWEAKKKFSNSWLFKNSQVFSWLKEWDKKGIDELIRAEKEIEKLSKNYLWHHQNRLSWYTLDSYYVNFQYIVELLNRYPKELKLNKKLLSYNNSWFDDMYVSLRLSLMWHYRTSFFHLRSFIENYFELVWWYSEKNWYLSKSKLITLWLINKKTWEISEKISPRMKYFSFSWKVQEWWKEKNLHNFSSDYYFHWEELSKVYHYLSKFTHLENDLNLSYSDQLKYNEKYLDLYYRLWWLALILVSRMLYSFMSHNIEKVWLNPLIKPIPWERNYYRYVIWEMIWDNWLFYDLYEDKVGRKLFLHKNWMWLDVNRLIWDAEDKIKDIKMYDRLRKEAWGDRGVYKELIYKNLEKNIKNNI